MKPRKRIIVEARKQVYITKYSIVGQVRRKWRWKDVQFFCTFRSAMDWIQGGKEEQL